MKLTESNWWMESYSEWIVNGPKRAFLNKSREGREILPVIKRTHIMVCERIYI